MGLIEVQAFHMNRSICMPPNAEQIVTDNDLYYMDQLSDRTLRTDREATLKKFNELRVSGIHVPFPETFPHADALPDLRSRKGGLRRNEHGRGWPPSVTMNMGEEAGDVPGRAGHSQPAGVLCAGRRRGSRKAPGREEAWGPSLKPVSRLWRNFGFHFSQSGEAAPERPLEAGHRPPLDASDLPVPISNQHNSQADLYFHDNFHRFLKLRLNQHREQHHDQSNYDLIFPFTFPGNVPLLQAIHNKIESHPYRGTPWISPWSPFCGTLGQNGNCTATVGHLDPLVRGEDPACNATIPQTCQVGDLSGKYGKVTSDAFEATLPDDFGSLNIVSNASI
ncbi:hypothetical protein G7054_g15205 [Neopestalotiopsis clavispora]|nr:hypothetical protein G7054_g15205 [Neopestalotiopsis clavispora]